MERGKGKCDLIIILKNLKIKYITLDVEKEMRAEEAYVYVFNIYLYMYAQHICMMHVCVHVYNTHLCVCVIDMCSCCMQMCTSSGSRTPHDNEMKLDRSDEYLCQIKPYWKFSKTGEYFNSDVWFICNYMNNS